MPDPARIALTASRAAALSSGPVPIREVIATGVSPGQMRAALSAGVLISLRRGIVLPRERWGGGSPEERRRWALEAALLAYPEACASHGTAAILHGLPDYRLGPPDEDGIPVTHVTRLGAARRDGWLRVHGGETPSEWIEMAAGLPATDLVRTSIELSATRSLRTAVVFIDAAMRAALSAESGHVDLRDRARLPQSRAALNARWQQGLIPYSRHRWVTRVRQAVDVADPSAESVLESLSRAAIHESDIPVPECGVPLVGDDGRTYWVDMLWERQRVIGEADGAVKYSDPTAMYREKRRQETLEARGWRFVRWGMPEVDPDPGVMVSRIRRALAR